MRIHGSEPSAVRSESRESGDDATVHIAIVSVYRRPVLLSQNLIDGELLCLSISARSVAYVVRGKAQVVFRVVNTSYARVRGIGIEVVQQNVQVFDAVDV